MPRVALDNQFTKRSKRRADERSVIRHRAVRMSAECASDFPPYAASLCRALPLIRAGTFSAITMRPRCSGSLAAGSTRDQILTDYPCLEPEDIDEALQYAALLAEDETVELAR